MRFLKNNHTNPYFNMAFDEYCLEKLSIEEPVFYLWQNRPSVIVGANQEVKTEVNLDYLKENIEFIMLSKEQFAIIKQQLSKLVQLLDASTRLLFAQNLTAAMTDDGNSLIEMLFDVFEKDLIDMLELSDATRKAIEKAK